MTAVGEQAPRHRALPARPTSRLRRAVPLLAAATGGALAALAYPPPRIPGAALLGVAIGMWAMLRAGSPLRAAVCGFAWGAGLGAVLFRWALALDPIAYVGLVPVQALFWAAAGALVALGSRRAGADGWWVVWAASAWTLAEVVRARWPLGGFEWGQAGLAAVELPILPAASIVGTAGMTALTSLLAAGLVAAATRRLDGWRPLAAALAVSALLTGLGAVQWTVPSGALDVAVVQVDDPCPGAFAVDCPRFREVLLERHTEGTAALEGEFDLILWGEGTLRAGTPEQAGRDVVGVLGELPAPLLSGVTNPAGPGRFYQRNALIAPDGEVLAVYSKRHPVPFGEYVPWRSVLGRVADVGRFVPSDIVRGERAVPMPVPHGDGDTVDLGTVVSWEVTFSRVVRSAARHGDALATLTTQASYGPGQPVSDQLLAAAQMRAAELQKAMVVAAATGRSALILPDGELREPTALYAADELTGQLPLRTGLTPYARWGEAPVIAAALGGLVLVGGRLRGWPQPARDSEPRR